MTADLRRLAREGHFVPDVAQTILALLDERDRLQGDVEWLVNVQEERDRLRLRVAALEEQIAAVTDRYTEVVIGHVRDSYSAETVEHIFAPLLAAAPSIKKIGLSPEALKRAEPDPHPVDLMSDPAALPAEEFPKQVGDPTNENPYDKAEGRYHAQHAHTEVGYCLLNEEPDPLYSAGRGDISSYDPSQRGER